MSEIDFIDEHPFLTAAFFKMKYCLFCGTVFIWLWNNLLFLEITVGRAQLQDGGTTQNTSIREGWKKLILELVLELFYYKD